LDDPENRRETQIKITTLCDPLIVDKKLYHRLPNRLPPFIRG